MHQRGDIRRSLIDGYRQHDGMAPVAWTTDLFESRDVIPFGAYDDEGFVKGHSAMHQCVGQPS
eukprot:11586434-Karenia_brevis.AAC.1